MSLDLIKSVFEQMTTTRAWSVCLVKIKKPRNSGTAYATRGVTLMPDGALTEFIGRLSTAYLDPAKGVLRKYSSVCDYDGTTESVKIYRLLSDSQLIADEYSSLISAFSTPEMAGNPFEFAANAYSLKATLCIDGNDIPVFAFSMQNPICLLKNRFLYDEGSFHEIKDKVLNLRPTIDVLIIGATVYLLTMAGENLFNMERSYKALCDATVFDICESEIVSNTGTFSNVAKSGHNPRRFVSYNKGRLERMKDEYVRREMARMFNLTLSGDGKIDTSADGVAEKLVKLLCNKGMVDPFEEVPVEVPSAAKW